jgi:hypothetical protein
VSFVKLCTFEPFFFQELNFDFETSVDLSKLSGLDGVTLLDLKGVGSDFLDFVSSFRKLLGELIVFSGEKGVFFEKSFTPGFELINFSGADLEDGDFIEEPSVLSLAAVCIFECDLLFDEIALRFEDFDRRSVVRRSFAGGVSVVGHCKI